MTRENYTTPVIYKNGNDWFVYFEYFNEATGKFQPFKKREGLNRIKNLREKESEFKALRNAREGRLKIGWNPITNTFPVKEVAELEIDRLKKLTLSEALSFGLKKCNISPKSKSCYAVPVRFAQEAAQALSLAETPVIDIERIHVKMLMDHIATDKKWSNKAYNKNLGYLKAVFTRVEDWEIIKNTPAHRIKTRPVDETEKFVPYTAEEKKKLQEYLFIHHYLYFVNLMIIYHTGIRPKETLALKIKDIDLEKQVIKILPDFVAENSKTRKIRHVAINNELLPFLRELELSKYPKEYYVFGSPFEAGQGNRGSTKFGNGAMHPDYFKPSLTRIKRDTVTKLWKTVVKDGLGIDKYQYAMKRTGGDDKIMAGIDISALQELYGHSSRFMTEKYARKVKEVYRKQIVELSPSFHISGK